MSTEAGYLGRLARRRGRDRRVGVQVGPEIVDLALARARGLRTDLSTPYLEGHGLPRAAWQFACAEIYGEDHEDGSSREGSILLLLLRIELVLDLGLRVLL